MITCSIIGDSITKGTYTAEGDSCPASIASPCFAELIGERLGLAIKNYGINGVSISRVSPTNREYAISENIQNVEVADILIVAAGTNDYGNHVPLGEETDEEDISFYGGLHLLAKRVKERFSKVIFILPIKRQGENAPNKDGHTLEEYRTAIEKIALKNGFFVVNGKNVAIEPDEEESRKKYILDGLHPNNAGHKLYADYIISCIEEIL